MSFLTESRWSGRFFPAAVLGAGLLPVLLIAGFSAFHIHKQLTASALTRRQSVAFLSAAVLKERLDRMVDLTVSLSTRVRFRQCVAEGRWEEAVEILRAVPGSFPFVDRIYLSDPDGTLRSDTPALPGVRGKNFAFRDWYQGVTRSGKPYVSGVYKRTAEPRLNVVAVAAPVGGEDGSPAGYLVLQIRLDAFFRDVGIAREDPVEHFYFTDQNGHAVHHPRFNVAGDLLDLISRTPVRRALRGERGVMRAFDPAEGRDYVEAFEPVPGYGWAAVVREPADVVFGPRRRALRAILLFYGAVLLLNALLAGLILSVVRRLKDARALLQEANGELESFSYSVSHDLRAPLRAIDGFSRILEEDHAHQLDAEGKRFLGVIRENTRRMGRLIDDLLAFSRLSRKDMGASVVDMAALARAAALEAREAEKGRSVEVTVGPLPPARGDEAMLRQLWVNLLSNAFKFTRPVARPAVEIGWRAEEGAYFVKDNGVGFDMKYRDKLFTVFQRLHPREEFEGTGVGLALVQRIARRHGGRVWADAPAGGGAVFFFTLGRERGPS